jgi:branched-subunit amino acid aminotransferase/4-amino-4-deoxychorismate lyase
LKVWINGTFVDGDDAKVSVFDAGFQHGVGLFETMVAKNGVVFKAIEHMSRLAESAAMLRLTENLKVEPLVEALCLILKENDQESARVRLTVTGGDLNMLQRTGNSGGGDPTIVIQTQPPTEYPPSFFENGVMVSIASGRVNPYEFGAGHKTLHYWPSLLNLQLAAMQQCGESLLLTQSALVAGGCVSNLFVVNGGTLFTPVARGEEDGQDEPSAVLPGITRSTIIQLADGLGIGTSRNSLTLDDVLAADEVFLTNSSWGVLPVVGLLASVLDGGNPTEQAHSIGDNSVGPVSNQLVLAYKDLLEQETRGVSV